MAGLLTNLITYFFLSLPLSFLAGVLIMAGTFVFSSLLVLWPMSSEQTEDNAGREDFNPFLEEALVVIVALAALVGIVVILVTGNTGARNAAALLGLLGVFLTWGMLHLMYTTRYAHMYYSHPIGGIDFNDQIQPRYVDFMYFSYNLGMTYQVSDNNVSTTAIRSVVLRHCLLSYVFGTVVLAATINLVLGVVGG